jgi:hypothetical protein
MDPAASVEEAFGSITLGLFGADRRTDSDGRSLAPLMVVSGDQVFGIFAVKPNDDGGPWVTVSIESDERWTVSAVIGTVGRPESLLDDLRGGDLDGLFSDGADPAGRTQLRFAVPNPKQEPKLSRTSSARSRG